MDKITLLGSMIDTYTFEQEWNEEMNNVELFCYFNNNYFFFFFFRSVLVHHLLLLLSS
jgi:hypothetical protein